jgi:hypothetical protein
LEKGGSEQSERWKAEVNPWALPKVLIPEKPYLGLSLQVWYNLRVILMKESIKTHLLLIGTGTVVAAFSLGSIVRFSDPGQAGILLFIFLYSSIFLSCLGFFTFLGLVVRSKTMADNPAENLAQSSRQALLLAILISVSLILQSFRLLFWWVELTLLLFLVCIEVFFHVE